MPRSPIVRGRIALVTVLYRDLLGRAPEPSGLRFYLNQLASGMWRGLAARAIAMSPEHRRWQRAHRGKAMGLRPALFAALGAEWRVLTDARPHPAGPAPLFRRTRSGPS